MSLAQFFRDMIEYRLGWPQSSPESAHLDPDHGGTDEGYLLEHNTTQLMRSVHPADRCADDEACTIHNRSNHPMRGWPQYWRGDRNMMERICPHGVGHPDPDEINPDTVHGCDGCCTFAMHEIVVDWNVDDEYDDFRVPGFIQGDSDFGLKLKQVVVLTDGVNRSADKIGEVISMRLNPEEGEPVIYGVRFQP
jgi:hypothetical protein